MSDPKRLVDRFGPGFERDLLSSAADEEPATGARERVHSRVLEVAALAAGAGASAASAGGAGGKASSSLGVVLLKWLGVGAVAGTVSAYVGSELTSPDRPVPATSEAPASLSLAVPPGPAARSLPIAPSVTPEVTIEGRPAPSGSADSLQARGDVRIGAPSTLVEAESMRRIRVEARMNRARASRLLDEHLMRFPNGESAGEAKRLRATLGK